MTSTLGPDEHARLAQLLARWGTSPEEIAAVLADASFGPGVISVTADPDLPPGVGIIIDTDTDQALGALLGWRTRASNEDVAAGVEVSQIAATTFLCPDGPEALLAYTIQLSRPWELRRTFLLMLSTRLDIYAALTRPGTTIWLVPHRTAIREWAREDTGTANDVWHESLPIAQTTSDSLAIAHALQHIANTTRSDDPVGEPHESLAVPDTLPEPDEDEATPRRVSGRGGTSSPSSTSTRALSRSTAGFGSSTTCCCTSAACTSPMKSPSSKPPE
jgi:hypothetical protein